MVTPYYLFESTNFIISYIYVYIYLYFNYNSPHISYTYCLIIIYLYLRSWYFPNQNNNDQPGYQPLMNNPQPTYNLPPQQQYIPQQPTYMPQPGMQPQAQVNYNMPPIQQTTVIVKETHEIREKEGPPAFYGGKRIT